VRVRVCVCSPVESGKKDEAMCMPMSSPYTTSNKDTKSQNVLLYEPHDCKSPSSSAFTSFDVDTGYGNSVCTYIKAESEMQSLPSNCICDEGMDWFDFAAVEVPDEMMIEVMTDPLTTYLERP
jgi:hypothetical protein